MKVGIAISLLSSSASASARSRPAEPANEAARIIHGPSTSVSCRGSCEAASACGVLLKILSKLGGAAWRTSGAAAVTQTDNMTAENNVLNTAILGSIQSKTRVTTKHRATVARIR